MPSNKAGSSRKYIVWVQGQPIQKELITITFKKNCLSALCWGGGFLVPYFSATRKHRFFTLLLTGNTICKLRRKLIQYTLHGRISFQVELILSQHYTKALQTSNFFLIFIPSLNFSVLLGYRYFVIYPLITVSSVFIIALPLNCIYFCFQIKINNFSCQH